MINLLLGYKNMILSFIVAAIIMGIVMYVSSLKDEVQVLKLDNSKLHEKLLLYRLESERLESSVAIQNKEIELLKHNESLAKAELKSWKAKKPEVKYKTITKIREVHSDECKDIKNTINAVRSIDYSNL